MPTIDTFPDATRAYVRVETNWADVPSAQYVGVDRVDAATGVATPLRPYVCYSGWCILTSCGLALFWDTEVPLDRPVFYRAHACPDLMVAPACMVLDSFTRTVVDGWGSADVGGAWTLAGGTVGGDYDVTGTKGTHTLATANTSRNSSINVGQPNHRVRLKVGISQLATGAALSAGASIRHTDTSNRYVVEVRAETTNAVTLSIASVVAGVLTILATTTLTDVVHVAGAEYWIIGEVVGSTLRGKAWVAGTAEPDAWTLTTVNTTLATGNSAGVRSIRYLGNTNVNPVMSYDDVEICDPCDDFEAYTVETGQLTVASNGLFRLRDPVRPCHDLTVPVCAPDVEGGCTKTGISFEEMDVEQFAANSFSLPVTNRANPIAITRARRGVSSNLHLITHTFVDRDAVNTLLAPGSPVLWQGPPQYGIPDRYMDVGLVSVARGLQDHTVQARKIALPHVQVDRPAGPTQGVCGNRVMDLCDVYASWTAMAAAGLTWNSLLQGAASTPDPTDGLRTWADVNSDFANWTPGVNDGVRTWQGLLEGD